MNAFLWPDHIIGKRESRQLREAHNALYNSHAELVAALERIADRVQYHAGGESPFSLAAIGNEARAVLAKAKGGV